MFILIKICFARVVFVNNGDLRVNICGAIQTLDHLMNVIYVPLKSVNNKIDFGERER